jgi:dihydrofolate reductase
MVEFPAQSGQQARWIAVAAMGANRVIGRDGELPWHIPGDLKFFKQLTTGGTILMGRKTHDSIGRPLPKRRNLVLSRTGSGAEGVEVFSSLDEIDRTVPSDEKIYVIGGAEVYRLTMDRWDEVYLTRIEGDHEGDTFLPKFEDQFAPPVLVAEGEGFFVELYRRVSA